MPGLKRFARYDCFQTGQCMLLVQNDLIILEFHALLKRVTLANKIAAKGRAKPRSN